MEIAHEIINMFPELKLKISGSLSRNQVPNDIDFITNKKLPENRQYIRGQFKGFNYDIFYYKNLAVGKFLRNYPSHLVIAVRKGLSNNGYILDNQGIKNLETGEYVPFTAKKAFQLSGIKYRPLSYYFDGI